MSRHVPPRVMALTLLAVLLISRNSPTHLQAQPPPPGAVRMADTFDDPAVGVLPQESTDPERRFGYRKGEYLIEKLDPMSGFAYVQPPGRYADATLAVDVRMMGDTEGRYAFLACRATDAGVYRLYVDPAAGTFGIIRWDNATQVNLVSNHASPLIRRGNATNRLELRCAGNFIIAAINGVVGGAVQDDTHEAGELALGIGSYTGRPLPAEARFDDLHITQQAPVPPGTVLLAETFDDPARRILPLASPNPAIYCVAYTEGAYQVTIPSLSTYTVAEVMLPAWLQDSTMAVDVRMTTAAPGRQLFLYCRESAAGSYHVVVDLTTEQVMVNVSDTSLVSRTPPSRQIAPLRSEGQANRVEFSCIGDRITLVVNGIPVLHVQNRTHRAGRLSFWVTEFGPHMPTTEARFDNLTVTTASATPDAP
jgi:hypothetical protein